MDIPMCLVGKMTGPFLHVQEIAEDDAAIATAKEQGWSVIWRSSALRPSQINPAQSGPNRTEDE